MKKRDTETRDVLVRVHGVQVEAVAEYWVEFEPKDESVGIMSESVNVHLVRVVVTSSGQLVLDLLDKKEREHLEGRIAECEAEDMPSEAERRQAAEEDAWDAKRHGD